MSVPALLVVLFAFQFTVVTCRDLTLSAGADGKEVVEAVVDLIRSKCIFPDDRLLLRRLAFVETRDGEDSKTYRPGYHGGIWQLNETKYLETKTCPSSISAECNIINSEFGINWSNTKWEDLRKPLYSGLGAALFILKQNEHIVGDVASQGTFWSTKYNPDGQASYFETMARELLSTDCFAQLDLAFILDGSGSISRYNFARMLKFTKKVISSLTISEQVTKVAAIEYSSVVGDIINFNNYSSVSTLLRQIFTIRKQNRGTNTAAAIDATVNMFRAAAGARANAKKVALLLTDGASNSYTATVAAAEAAKDSGIVMFAIGVGNVNERELQAVASDPNCTHFFLLKNFQEIDSMMHEIQKSSCKAPKVLNIGGNTDGVPQNVTQQLPANLTSTNTFQVKPHKGENSTGEGNDDKEKVFKAEVQCGILQLYASYDTPQPGPAFYDIEDQATDGKPAIVYLNTSRDGRPLYITVIANKLPESAQDVLKCVNAHYTITITDAPKKAEIICRVGNIERKCTRDDFKQSEYKDMLCSDRLTGVQNPCTEEAISKENLFHAHPSDRTKFIRCDMTGKMYIIECPTGTAFNPSTKSCNHESVEVSDGTPSDSDVCSASNLAAGKFYFPYPSDDTKYIQCDVWGKSWVKPCPANHVWRQDATTCDHHPVAVPQSQDPCTAAGEFHTHSDPSKFIRCLSSTSYVVMDCSAGLVFNLAIKACTWPSG